MPQIFSLIEFVAGTKALASEVNSNFETLRQGHNNQEFRIGEVESLTDETKLKLNNLNIINIKDYGAKGDGITDDTTAIQTALDTGKTVFFPSPSSFYKITDTLIIKTSGLKVYGESKELTRIKNDTNDKPLLYVGDPTVNETGFAHRVRVENLHFTGNENTTSGITLWGKNSVNAFNSNNTWTDASKACVFDNVQVDSVGNGYAWRIYSWCNTFISPTCYAGNKYGMELNWEANSNTFIDTYLSACTNEALIIGEPTKNQRPTNNNFYNLTAQFSGGTNGAVHIYSAYNTIIDGFYTENISAPTPIYLDTRAINTIVRGVNHISTNESVIQTAGQNVLLENVLTAGGVQEVVKIFGTEQYTSTRVVNARVRQGALIPANGFVNDTSTYQNTQFEHFDSDWRPKMGVGLGNPLSAIHVKGTRINGKDYITCESNKPAFQLINTFGGGSATAIILCGTGSPEGAWSAPQGSLYLRVDGGATTSLYVKASGTGNTGWVAK